MNNCARFLFLVIAAIAIALEPAAAGSEASSARAAAESGASPAAPVAAHPAAASGPKLEWSPATGVSLATAHARVLLDQASGRAGPTLRFAPGDARRLEDPRVSRLSEAELVLEYNVAAPGGVAVRAERRIAAFTRSPSAGAPPGSIDIVETFRMTFPAPVAADLEVERPFSVLARQETPAPGSAVFPLQNGWAHPADIAGGPASAEYRLGTAMPGGATPQLALPVIEAGVPGFFRAAVCADPRFSALFEVSAVPGGILGGIRYRYAGTRVPLEGEEVRTFAFAISPPPPGDEPFGLSIDDFFRLELPDVPPGPAWLHEIALVSYDYLSDGGKGWDRDVDVLARLLSLEERGRAALCFHGWYDGIGSYAFDDASGRMKDRWTAMPRTRKVEFTKEEVRARLGRTRDLGFRVLWYFGDGLVQDSGIPEYRAEWNLLDEAGRSPRDCWTGPDTFAKTFIRNPAHPEVARWYLRYLEALLDAYGDVIDGIVWDEPYYVRQLDIARSPKPAYCARAMMDLMKDLAARVRARDPEKVFLSSDDVGIAGQTDIAGYAMVAHGTYQDSWCHPAAWSYGLFPNWRNVLWSCNWNAMTRFHHTRWGVERFGVPVAISNGWEDDRGPSEWTSRETDAILRLFRKRLAAGPRVRFLTADPAKLLVEGPDAPSPRDVIPEPAAGEVNWALATGGATATASSASEYGGGSWGPSGLIDGRRDAKDWGRGHGWASKDGEPLPQWVEVRFSAERKISRFVVIAYEDEGSAEKASKWGVTDYEIQSWDAAAGAWRKAVEERRGRAMAVRVHTLAEPIRAQRIRIVVSDVAPLDGVARLLALEAWGPGGE